MAGLRAHRLCCVWSLLVLLAACGRVGIELMPPDSGPPDSGSAYCPTACENGHGSASCAGGSCALECALGWADCDGDPGNGCETSTSDTLASCGGCALSCTNPNGSTSCNAGTCAPMCAAGGYGDCDGDMVNGCESALSSTTNCGGCGTGCSNDHGATGCDGGACTPTCEPGYRSCDGDASNGCETNLADDPRHCGDCATVCDAATQICVAGSCALSPCMPGRGECNGDATPADFCETDTTSTLAHCGFCGNACVLANATPRCTASSCAVASCSSGYGDCDGQPTNGCETRVTTSAAHCGRCQNACTNAHGTTVCTNGGCVPTCATGWGNCDGNFENGCETPLDTLTNCGQCGRACTTSVPGAIASCGSGVCTATCTDLSGVYALRIVTSTTWPSDGFIASGMGNLTFVARAQLTQSGNTLTGTATECDRTVPDFRNSVTSETYGVQFPSAVFERALPPANIAVTLASPTVGASFSVARTALVLGVRLTDPVNGAWPSLSQVSPFDDDGDGDRGVTIDYKSGSGYSFPPTAGSLIAARARRGALAERLVFALVGSLTSCTQATGSATTGGIDTHTVGCRLTTDAACSSSQYTHLDSNAPKYVVRSATYSLVRVGAPGASVSCASVRAAAN